MNTRAEVSVVIPAYNAERFISETLESVLEQDGVSVETVVVDDGSTDNTKGIVRAFAGHVRLLEGGHKGAQAARNAGIAQTSARFVKFLDADDLLLKGSLKRQVSQAMSLDENAVPYGPARWMSESGEMSGVVAHTSPSPNLHPVAHMLFYSPITSCPLHRRELIELAGTFDESLPREQEHDLHLRLVLAGARFVHDSEPVYAYRRHKLHKGLMSGGMARFGDGWLLDYLHRQESRIRKHFAGTVPDDVLVHLAWFYWKSGRAFLREGFKDASARYFEEARRVSPSRHVYGRRLYRWLNTLTGPVWAERALQFVRGS